MNGSCDEKVVRLIFFDVANDEKKPAEVAVWAKLDFCGTVVVRCGEIVCFGCEISPLNVWQNQKMYYICNIVTDNHSIISSINEFY